MTGSRAMPSRLDETPAASAIISPMPRESRGTVLVVDDEPTIVEVVSRYPARPAGAADGADLEPIVHGPLTIDQAARTVTLDGEELPLTQREFELLRFLAARPGRVFSRDQLMEEVWGYDFYTDTSTVTVHVR